MRTTRTRCGPWRRATATRSRRPTAGSSPRSSRRSTRAMATVPSGGGPLAYVDDLEAPVLSDADHHHLARVRRVRDGDPMVIGDGAGAWRAAAFAGQHPEPTAEVQREAEPQPRLQVAFALVKGAKPELVVQKLVELGIDIVRPFVAVRSVVQWDERKAAAAHARWEKVAVEAAMQSRRAWLPTVEPLATFAAVAALPGAHLADRAMEGAAVSGPTAATTFVMVGPEGGWDEAERAMGLPTVALAPT